MARGDIRGRRTGGCGLGDGALTPRPSMSAPVDTSASGLVPACRPSPVEEAVELAATLPAASQSAGPSMSASAVGSSTGGGLPIIHVEDGRLLPTHSCSSRMKKIFWQRIHPDGYAWKNVSAEYREASFEEFKKYFRWDELIDLQVKTAFLHQAAERYEDMIYDFKRKKALGRPPCVPEAAWQRWEAYWDCPDVKAKSDQPRRNRLTKHDAHECLARTQKRKNGQFVYEWSEQIAEEVQTRSASAKQSFVESSEPPAVDMSQSYVEVVGGVKKQRIYGPESKPVTFISTAANSSSTNLEFDIDALKKQVAKEVEEELQQHFKQKWAETQARLLAEMEAMKQERVKIQAEMQSIIHELMQAQPKMLDHMARKWEDLSRQLPPFLQPPNGPADDAAKKD